MTVTISQQRRSPGVLRRRLARMLRLSREAAGMSLPQGAALVGRDGSALSRLEGGQTQKFRPEVVAQLLRGYGCPQEQIDEALAMAQQLAAAGKPTPGWWEEYGGPPSASFGLYLELENDGNLITVWQPSLVPGLLQTPEYAAAVMTGPESPAERERRVRIRLARQAILDRDDPPTIQVVLDEAVLLRPLGSPDVLAAQTAHLLALTERPNIEVRIMPLDGPAHLALGGGPIHHFGPDDVVYLENHAGGLYLDTPGETETYVKMLDRLREAALSPEKSRRILASAATDA